MRTFFTYRIAALCALAAVALIVSDFTAAGTGNFVAPAYADDDGGGRGGKGGSRGRDRGERYDDDRPAIFQRFRKRRPHRVAAVAPRPIQFEPDVLIAQGLGTADVQRLTVRGYSVIERHRLIAEDVEVVKLRKPRGLTMAAARQVVQNMDPAATVDFNHFYRPDAEGCSGDRCLVRHIAGWPADISELECRPGEPVGLIDTQINTDHPALRPSRIVSIPLSPEAAKRSGTKHGTAIAALLVGHGEVTGLLPGWDLIAVDAFRKGDVATSLDLVRAIDILMERKVGVINMSLSGPDNALLRAIVAAAVERDILLVAAAGNDGPRAKPLYPAAYPEVVAVTAISRDKRIYRRAAQGAHIDIAAPGVNVWTAASISGQRPRTGTSFAAPFVAAASALIKANNPGFTVEEVKIVLENQADDLGAPGRDDVFGWGLLDIRGLCRP